MKSIKKYFILIPLLISPALASANWDSSIFGILSKMYKVETDNLPNLTDLQQISDYGKQSVDELHNNLQGNFNYGNLLNGDEDLKKRTWSQDNWVDVLSMTNSGNSSAFNSAQKTYSKLYPVVDASQIGSTLKNGDLTRTYYQQNSEISRAALASSSYSYDQVNDHIKNIHDILAKLEASPSEKAAIDLNTRLVAEVSFIQLENLKQQNFQTQIAATQSQGQVNGMSDASKFMQWNH